MALRPCFDTPRLLTLCAYMVMNSGFVSLCFMCSINVYLFPIYCVQSA